MARFSHAIECFVVFLFCLPFCYHNVLSFKMIQLRIVVRLIGFHCLVNQKIFPSQIIFVEYYVDGTCFPKHRCGSSKRFIICKIFICYVYSKNQRRRIIFIISFAYQLAQLTLRERSRIHYSIAIIRKSLIFHLNCLLFDIYFFIFVFHRLEAHYL